jgi:hypothetical protein
MVGEHSCSQSQINNLRYNAVNCAAERLERRYPCLRFANILLAIRKLTICATTWNFPQRTACHKRTSYFPYLRAIANLFSQRRIE